MPFKTVTNNTPEHEIKRRIDLVMDSLTVEQVLALAKDLRVYDSLKTQEEKIAFLRGETPHTK